MFDDARLDDQQALAAADVPLRRLAESGARVRREVGACAAVVGQLRSDDAPRAVVAAGADSRLLRAVLEHSCPVPFVAWPGPGLPGWAGSLDTVVVTAGSAAATSTDEGAISAVMEAVRRGCGLLIAAAPHSVIAELAAGRHTTLLPLSSEDPLAAAVVMLQAAHALGLGPDIDAESVATALDDVAVESSPFLDMVHNPAKELALLLADANPVLWGGTVLSARAARRVAEALRRATGRSCMAGDADQLLPVVAHAAPRDVFADPYDDGAAAMPPALVVLDDGTDDALIREQRGRLLSAASTHGVRTGTLVAAHGSPMARYASLYARGSYAAVYLGVGLRAETST
ncbi:MAG: hypothetical protein H0V13_08705 [Nocardioidaceae bacterium]|nr:hypothetical protein [Nocardioidaceae bacterium]